MPSNQTQNYQLSQWVKSDQVKMEDFNADNAKIDGALAAQAGTLAAHGETLAKKGNCRIVWGAYQGSGQYGAGHPNTLVFDGKPIAVFVLPTTSIGTPMALTLLRGATATFSSERSHNYVTWGENRVSWYSSDNNVAYQLNQSNYKYAYVALLAADE